MNLIVGAVIMGIAAISIIALILVGFIQKHKTVKSTLQEKACLLGYLLALLSLPAWGLAAFFPEVVTESVPGYMAFFGVVAIFGSKLLNFD